MTEKTLDLAALLKELARNGHAAHAIWVAASLENNLSHLLQLYMPKLSNRLRAKLFYGYGPFAHFSVKIDVAYALDLIPESLRRDLHVIREIRNSFAHATTRKHFGTDEMMKLLTKFSDYDPKMDRLAFYLEKLSRCRAVLQPSMQTLAVVAALKKTEQVTVAPSPEK
jgi:hypothetical protein